MGNGDPRKDQQQFRPNPNGVGDRTTAFRRVLIGAVASSSLVSAVPTRLPLLFQTSALLLTFSRSFLFVACVTGTVHVIIT